MPTTIPEKIKSLLWDSKIEDISLTNNAQYIIERVLEYGDLSEDKWMIETFSKDAIIKTITESKRLSAKTANYYAHIYNINPVQIECLRNPYTQKQNRF